MKSFNLIPRRTLIIQRKRTGRALTSPGLFSSWRAGTFPAGGRAGWWILYRDKNRTPIPTDKRELIKMLTMIICTAGTCLTCSQDALGEIQIKRHYSYAVSFSDGTLLINYARKYLYFIWPVIFFPGVIYCIQADSAISNNITLYDIIYIIYRIIYETFF